jgi:hypothetical protein
MHDQSIRHVRDHAKAQGTEHHMLEFISVHVNEYTGEAFELTVDRVAHRLNITSQWVRQLRARLVQSGELIVRQSPGRRPNVYMIPYADCPACQAANPKLQLPVDPNPKLLATPPDLQPETRSPSTRNSDPANPKLQEGPKALGALIGSLKDNVRKEETEKNVNVGINPLNPKLPNALTFPEEDLVDELVRRFRDEKSRPTYRRIVGKLGVGISYPIMLNVWEVRDRIAVSPGAYFVGIAKNVAQENGIDLGFRRASPPSTETTR